MGDGSGDETENRCASGNVRAGSEVIGVRMHGTYACPDRKGMKKATLKADSDELIRFSGMLY